MEQRTFLYQGNQFSDMDRYATLISFELSIILLDCIVQIIYIIISYHNKFSVPIFFPHGHRNFSRNIILSKFGIHVVNISWLFFRKLLYSFSIIVGHLSSSISIWIKLFISTRLLYERASDYWIKLESLSVFPTLDILIVSEPFHELRCSTILHPVELYPTCMCFTVRGLTTPWKTWSDTGDGILLIHLQQWICIKLYPPSWSLHVSTQGYPSTKEIFVILSNQYYVAIYHIHY